jgi:hypothetical protein
MVGECDVENQLLPWGSLYLPNYSSEARELCGPQSV